MRALQPWIHDKNLADIHRAAEGYKTFSRHLAPATVNRRLAILRRVANLAYHTWEWLDAPLAEKIKLASEAGTARHVYLTREQVRSLMLACTRQETRDAIVIAVSTGMRQGEIWALKPEQIVDGCISLDRTKNGFPRRIPIVGPVADALSRLPFRLHVRTMLRDYETAREAAGVPWARFHDLRHTCASWLLAEGVGLEIIGQVLGHADARTTRRYAHLSTDTARAALERIRLA